MAVTMLIVFLLCLLYEAIKALRFFIAVAHSRQRRRMQQSQVRLPFLSPFLRLPSAVLLLKTRLQPSPSTSHEEDTRSVNSQSFAPLLRFRG